MECDGRRESAERQLLGTVRAPLEAEEQLEMEMEKEMEKRVRLGSGGGPFACDSTRLEWALARVRGHSALMSRASKPLAALFYCFMCSESERPLPLPLVSRLDSCELPGAGVGPEPHTTRSVCGWPLAAHAGFRSRFHCLRSRNHTRFQYEYKFTDTRGRGLWCSVCM